MVAGCGEESTLPVALSFELGLVELDDLDVLMQISRMIPH